MGWAGEKDTADVSNGGSHTVSNKQMEICDISRHTKTLGVTGRRVAVPLRLTRTEQSPSWDADRSSASQDVIYILYNPNVHYRVRNSPPLVPILSQINSVHALPSFLRFNKVLPSTLGLPSGLFPSGFPPKSSMHYFSPPYVPHALPISFP
jgi:hypothetical protein